MKMNGKLTFRATRYNFTHKKGTLELSRRKWMFYSVTYKNWQTEWQTDRASESERPACAVYIDGPGSSSGSGRGLRRSTWRPRGLRLRSPPFCLPAGVLTRLSVSFACPACVLCCILLASSLACLSAGPPALATCHHCIYEVLETSHSNAIISVIYTSHLCTSYTNQPLIE